MRKAFIIVIVAVMLTSMFACSNSKEPNSPTEPASTQGNVTSTPNESSQPDTPPPEEEGPYKFAAGKYETMEFPLKVKETPVTNTHLTLPTKA